MTKIQYRRKIMKPEFRMDKIVPMGYNEGVAQKKYNNIFNDDMFANSAIDYLYADENFGKTEKFLKNNGFPTVQERQINKELYGEQEERKNVRNLLKDRTNSLLNQTTNDNDRAFLHGLMGETKGELDYQKQILDEKRALQDMYGAFRGSEFERGIKPVVTVGLTPSDVTHTTSANTEKNSGLGKDVVQDFGNEYQAPQPNKVRVSTVLENVMDSRRGTVSAVTVGGSTFNNLNDVYKKAKQTVKNAGSYVDDVQKNVQRAIWKEGAQHLLREKWNCETSAWMLEHALQDNPSDIWRGNDSRIAFLINNDSAYLTKLDAAIKASKDGTIDQDLPDIQFNKHDLYYSIHRANIHVKGYRQDDGKWIVHATLSDTYDFTEIMTLMEDGGGWSMQAGVGTLANDAAVISQCLGAINPYKVHVEFYTKR